MPKKVSTPKSKLPDKLDNIKKDKFIEFYSRDEVRGNISMACDAVGVHRQTYYYWLENDKKFREIIKEKKMAMCDDMEQILVSRAVDKSDTALIFWLKNRHPDFKQGPTVVQQFNVGGDASIRFLDEDGHPIK